MGFFDRLKSKGRSQFIEIIEWLDDSPETLVHRYPVRDQEIKMGARLTVRENQAALLVNEGKAADLFAPGLHELVTRNIPLLTTLKSWKHGFESPFKAEVYFFNMHLFPDLKWGTSQPVMMRDKEFGMIRVRAFGTYALRVANPRTLFTTLVGTRGLTTTDQITGQLRSIILSRFSDALAEADVAALDLASRYDELSELGAARIASAFESFGLELSRFVVENISLSEEVQSAIDQKTRLGVLGGSLNDYTRLQTAEALTIAAASDSGAAGAGVGVGAGVAMGQALGAAMSSGGRQDAGTAPSPPPPPARAAARLTLNL